MSLLRKVLDPVAFGFEQASRVALKRSQPLTFGDLMLGAQPVP